MRRFDPISFLSRTLLTLVIGGAVLVIGAKFWLNYQLEQRLTQLQQGLSPVGILSWRSVYNTFGGKIGVEELALLQSLLDFSGHPAFPPS